MATEIASLYATIGADTSGLDKGLKETKTQLSSFAGGVTDLMGGIGALGAAAIGAGAIIQQAFAFGAEGAQVAQTAASFDLLMSKIGASSDVLDRLRQASRGTVDDLTLMQSTALLVAGTSGKLASSLADATPQLMEIAKAAQKLNPALGDVTFLYDSLAKGIKRASPLILDNLGIMVRLGDANQKYAESLGRSVGSLTEEEKKIALLNAVLEQGAVMMDQVGGSTVSMTDSFKQLDTATKNLSDALKAQLAPGLASAAQAAATLLTWNDQIEAGYRIHAAEVARTAESYTAYTAELERAAKANGYFVDSSGNLMQVLDSGMGATMPKLVQQSYMLSEAQWDAARATQNYVQVTGAGQASLDAWSARMQGLAGATGVAAQNSRALAAAAREEDQAMRLVQAGLSGQVGQAYETYTETMRDLTAEHDTLTAQLTKALTLGWSPTSRKVTELNDKLKQNEDRQKIASQAMNEATKAMIFQQAAAGLDAASTLELARAMGQVSEQDYAIAKAIQSLRNEYDQNQDGAISAAEGADQYTASVQGISQAIDTLQANDMPVTLQGIQEEMAATAASADPAAGAIETMGRAAKGAGDEVGGLTREFKSGLPLLSQYATAAKKLQESIAKLQSKSITITVTYEMRTTGGGGGGGGYGGGGYSPNTAPGYNPVNGAITETSGSMTVINNNYSAGAAALAYAQIKVMRRDRLNTSMGR